MGCDIFSSPTLLYAVELCLLTSLVGRGICRTPDSCGRVTSDEKPVDAARCKL